MIRGEVVRRPQKRDLSADIAEALGLSPPPVSRGSSVDSTFLDRVYEAVARRPSGGADAYRKTEALMDRLGLTYDSYWDTSESSPTGGSTVTTRAYSRIRTAVTGVPRCFILNVNDAEIGNRWERDHEKVYRYDDTVSGRKAFTEAGPGARIVYYATHKSKTNPKHFVACAEVNYISSGWAGPWEAQLTDYSAFGHPLSVEGVDLPDWNRQVSLTEITFATYQAILDAGSVAATGTEKAEPESVVDDPGGDVVAERVTQDFPVDEADPWIVVPDSLPMEVPPSTAATMPLYEETSNGVRPADSNPLPSRSQNRRRDKLAEERAVALAIKALEKANWKFTEDCQKDGVGYDLEFSQGDNTLHVEVKGIQGSRLAFNLTPKEFWRAETDPHWVVVAVTSVLSPAGFKLHFVTRDSIVTSGRVITGFRVSP